MGAVIPGCGNWLFQTFQTANGAVMRFFKVRAGRYKDVEMTPTYSVTLETDSLVMAHSYHQAT